MKARTSAEDECRGSICWAKWLSLGADGGGGSIWRGRRLSAPAMSGGGGGGREEVSIRRWEGHEYGAARR